LALLALACLPGLAQADSSEVQYSNPVPTATGKPAPKHHEPVATESGNVDGPPSTPAGGGSKSNPSQVGSNKGSSPANGGDSKASAPKSGTGQGSPGGGSAENDAAQPQQGSQVGTAASENSDDSSPLVPILVAILVLAAISLGAVMLRRRRQASGPSVSPEAS
jgi:cobalamin biosynthesis Mg chelatase CobN